MGYLKTGVGKLRGGKANRELPSAWFYWVAKHAGQWQSALDGLNTVDTYHGWFGPSVFPEVWTDCSQRVNCGYPILKHFLSFQLLEIHLLILIGVSLIILAYKTFAFEREPSLQQVGLRFHKSLRCRQSRSNFKSQAKRDRCYCSAMGAWRREKKNHVE